ncbi:hypothetical protein [Iningainema tapete]|uniref:Polymerase nucleotidyl transferase domain-containing protein n=1 Tax=Iningainema tapete BLCC-T55 TaxID=2748662 RepID=A0A8J6XKX2_9CYAN|nr:hypothetical protein [Iningainema tapete]MBD2776618.1 hypothetical protein [Iningainema tapete BLCC-T55]
MEQNQWYHPVVEKVVEEIKVEFGNQLLGILLGRSVVSDSTKAQSDIDIYAVIRSSWRQHRAFAIAGVDVQLWINPAHQIQKQFQNTDAPEILDQFANGQILSDPEGVIAYLVQQAQYIWKQPTPAIPTQQLLKLRAHCIAQLKDAQNLLKVDEKAANFAMFSTLASVLEVHYKLQRRWTVQPKYQLHDLQKHAPEIESLVRCVLSDDMAAQQRYEYLSQLVNQVLQPLGGNSAEWKTTPELLTVG